MSKGRRVPAATTMPRPMSATIEANVTEIIDALRRGKPSATLICRATNVPYVRARLEAALPGATTTVDDLAENVGAFVIVSISL